MIFAFDFDSTISADPRTFISLMHTVEVAGHVAYVVTYRQPTCYPEDLKFLEDKGYKIFYTGQRAKRKFMQEAGIVVDVWVDDLPESITHDFSLTKGFHNFSGDTQ